MKEMRVEREHVATAVIAVIAVLVIVGGFASFSGLSVHEETLKIEMAKAVFRQSDVFDANVVVSPVTFMADESMMVYVDGRAVGVVALKQYLDDNGIDYGSEYKNLGQNNVEIVTLKNLLTIHLAEHVNLEHLRPGMTHSLRVEFSKGDAYADGSFVME
jgi:hypothetical protein